MCYIKYVIVWCDNIGLVSLIYLGWEFICVVCITLLCVQPIPILLPSFCAIPIFHFLI